MEQIVREPPGLPKQVARVGGNSDSQSNYQAADRKLRSALNG